MSIRLITQAWASPAKGNALLTLIALADGADDDHGRTWPSVATLQAKTKLSRPTLFRILADLEAAGLIRREHREGHSTMYYVLQGPPSQNETGADEAPGPGEDPGGSQNETGTRIAGETPPVSLARPRTVREPSTEPSDVAPPDGDAAQEGQLALVGDPSLPSTSAQRRKRDVLWEAVTMACAVDAEAITGSARGAYNRAVADLRTVGATPEEVLRRAAIYRATWPEARLTPTALARRWAEIGAYVPSSPAQRLRMVAEQEALRDRMRALDDQERRAAP